MKINDRMKQIIYRLCEVHFKQNLSKAANVSEAIPTVQKRDFKKKYLKLLKIGGYLKFENV